MAKRKPTDYQRRYRQMRKLGYDPARARRGAKAGCYIATCVYGSYDCPELWTLRRYRDNKLAMSFWGRAFIRCYYAISPTIVKMFGETRWFKKLFKGSLDKFVAKLYASGFDCTPYDDRDW